MLRGFLFLPWGSRNPCRPQKPKRSQMDAPSAAHPRLRVFSVIKSCDQDQRDPPVRSLLLVMPRLPLGVALLASDLAAATGLGHLRLLRALWQTFMLGRQLGRAKQCTDSDLQRQTVRISSRDQIDRP
jgi:hypothetical protein